MAGIHKCLRRQLAEPQRSCLSAVNLRSRQQPTLWWYRAGWSLECLCMRLLQAVLLTQAARMRHQYNAKGRVVPERPVRWGLQEVPFEGPL